jgi:predicted nucleic acid-binding protein
MENKFVLDASVLLKWFFTLESEATLAARVRADMQARRIRAYVPRYALIEVFNVLSLTAPFKGSPALTIAEVRRLLLKSPLFKGKLKQKRLRDTEFERALDIVHVHGVAFYDALYVALAERLGAKYVTADYKASSKLTGRPDITELRAY